MTPWRIITADVLDGLAQLEDASAQCCVTSPPYWGLRNYNVVGQLGLERTPDEYVTKMVAVFREVRRVLKDDGVLWLNLGDCYNAQPNQRKTTDKAGPKQASDAGSVGAPSRSVDGLKPKDLVGIPWMVAFALRADGWYLRSDVIWAKPNPMPESVQDRPTKAHEYVFMLTKAARYYWDAGAVAECIQESTRERSYAYKDPEYVGPKMTDASSEVRANGTWHGKRYMPEYRNIRTVWNIATHPYPEAHFATYPPKLVEPCVKSSSREGDLILDPFCGAGTTGLVANRLQRRFVGIELNAEYADMARDRIRDDAPLLQTEIEVTG